MLGAIAGDIIGMPHEGALLNEPPSTLMRHDCEFTDDTVLTVAIAQALCDGREFDDSLRGWWHRYPKRGYGGWFQRWANTPGAAPAASTSNGSAMRVSPVALRCPDPTLAVDIAGIQARITHDSDEAARGAKAIALATHMAINGAYAHEIREVIERCFYRLDRTVADYREELYFECACDDTVPKAIVAALEADCFEQVMVNAILIGGDVDTIAAMAGGIGEGLYGIPAELADWAFGHLPEEMQAVVRREYQVSGHGGYFMPQTAWPSRQDESPASIWQRIKRALVEPH